MSCSISFHFFGKDLRPLRGFSLWQGGGGKVMGRGGVPGVEPRVGAWGREQSLKLRNHQDSGLQARQAGRRFALSTEK